MERLAPTPPLGLCLVTGTRNISCPGTVCLLGLGPISSSLARTLPLGLSPWEQGGAGRRPEAPQARSLGGPEQQMQMQIGYLRALALAVLPTPFPSAAP
jgi:hypothetical protein